MIDFRPFRGVLPHLDNDECIQERVSPPYDIISAKELSKLQGHEHNITRITLGGLDGQYGEAARLLDEWISSGHLVQDDCECYYLYRQSFQGKEGWLSRDGIIGILRTEGYEEGNIIPHEETFSKVKEDRLNLLRATATHCESIFGLYDNSEIDIEELSGRADKLFEITDDLGTVHAIYRIHEIVDVTALKEMFSTKKMLIADGHHRYETAHRYSQENKGDKQKAYVLCTMVSSEDRGMFVLPTHRLIHGLRHRPEELLERIKESFTVEEVDNTEALGGALDVAVDPTFGLLFKDGRMFVARHSPPRDDLLWSVDAHVFQEAMLKNTLTPLAEGNEIHMDYDHDISSAIKRMDEEGADLAVFVRAPSLDMVWKVAGSGRRMPKKTTYFWPKIWSGFVLHHMG